MNKLAENSFHVKRVAKLAPTGNLELAGHKCNRAIGTRIECRRHEGGVPVNYIFNII